VNGMCLYLLLTLLNQFEFKTFRVRTFLQYELTLAGRYFTDLYGLREGLIRFRDG